MLAGTPVNINLRLILWFRSRIVVISMMSEVHATSVRSLLFQHELLDPPWYSYVWQIIGMEDKGQGKEATSSSSKPPCGSVLNRKTQRSVQFEQHVREVMTIITNTPVSYAKQLIRSPPCSRRFLFSPT